jgi:hypothetical protein
MSNNKPLYALMRDACARTSGTIINSLGEEALSGPGRQEFAAMIFALRSWLLPERDEPPTSPHMGSFVEHALWAQRQELRDLLLDEVERAERGE